MTTALIIPSLLFHTAETYQKLMEVSLDLTASSVKTKKKQKFRPLAEATRKDVAQRSESTKARSWSAVSDDFAGVFAQRKPEQPSQQPTGGQEDDFSDFQSSGHQQGAPSNFAAFPAANHHHAPALTSQQMQMHSGPSQPIVTNAFMSDTGQSGSVMQAGSHTIATSAYPGPLSSTNVLQGVQGQSPNSPQRKPTSSNFVPPPSGKPGSPTLNDVGGDASRFHPLYHKVFRLCRKPGDDFISTELLYPVLLSSKLPRVQLRDLWGRTNKGRPGKLSQMELFILLGLVGLAQVRPWCGLYFMYKYTCVHMYLYCMYCGGLKLAP